MILVIASMHSVRGDIFVGFLFLVVVWLIYQAMWVGRSSKPSLHDRSKIERKRTIMITPEREDPRIVGDVAHPWPKAEYPASRPNRRQRA